MNKHTKSQPQTSPNTTHSTHTKHISSADYGTYYLKLVYQGSTELRGYSLAQVTITTVSQCTLHKNKSLFLTKYRLSTKTNGDLLESTFRLIAKIDRKITVNPQWVCSHPEKKKKQEKMKYALLDSEPDHVATGK